MYTVKPTTRFRKDLKQIDKRGYNLDLLTAVIKTLAEGVLHNSCLSGVK